MSCVQQQACEITTGLLPLRSYLHEHRMVMHALRTRDDLLAAHEHVERVGELLRRRQVRSLGVGHRVERPDREWVLIHHEEIGAELLLHDVAKLFLDGRGEVVELALLLLGHARLAQQRDALGERDAQRRLRHGNMRDVSEQDKQNAGCRQQERRGPRLQVPCWGGFTIT